MSGAPRVIAGEARGTKLLCPAGLHTRPVPGRVKTGLFSIIGGLVEGAAVLDLYAGSGSLGIEALSRGAESCTFVENDPDACSSIRRNLEKTRLVPPRRDNTKGRDSLLPRVRLLNADVFKTVKNMRGEDGRFSIVFCDPPFDETRRGVWAGRFEEVVLAASKLLAPGGILVVREEDSRDSPRPVQGLREFDTRKWGRSRVRFFTGDRL